MICYAKKALPVLSAIVNNSNRCQKGELKMIFDRTSLRNKKVYIFGAGRRGMKILERLRKMGIEPIAFIDNNADVCGTEVLGLPVIPMGDAMITDTLFIVSSVEKEDIYNQLYSLNVKYVLSGDDILSAFIPVSRGEEDYAYAVPFNHYESPYADLDNIREREQIIFHSSMPVMGIDFNDERQYELLEQMKKIELIPWGKESTAQLRYHYDNPWYDKWCADVLYYMIRILSPKRIIEVGSGFSTALMLDTNSECFDDSIEIISIEPNPERLYSLKRDTDNLLVLERNVQQMSFDFWNQLQENDILLVDSSHVARVDSDVNYLIFEVLPRLNKKVYVHFHDIFYPMEYPKNWIFQGRAYNEMYMLRAFLMNNREWSIQFFGEYLVKEHSNWLNDQIHDIGGSIWIRKE